MENDRVHRFTTTYYTVYYSLFTNYGLRNYCNSQRSGT